MTKIINLTPHPLNIYSNGKQVESIPSSGIVRVKEEKLNIGIINGIPLVKKKFTEAEGLPEKKSDTVYFVSIIVMQALPNRTDLITSSNLVRDENGRILGCSEFSQL